MSDQRENDPISSPKGPTPPALEPSGPARSPLRSGVYVRLLILQFAFGLSYSAFLLLPKFLKMELHASATEIGWVSGVALVAAAIVGPLVGNSAGYVQRRSLLALSLVTTGVAGLCFTFATEVGPLIYVLRLLQGLSWVLVFNCTATMTADLVPKHRISEAIGFLGVAMMVTNALSPALVEPAAEHFGWGWAFGVPAVFSLLALLLIPHFPKDHESEQVQARPLSRNLLPVYYTALLMGAGIGVMFTYTQPFALRLGATRVGDFFFGYVATALFVRLVFARLADRVGPAKVVTRSLACYSLVLLLTARLTPGTLAMLGAGLGASHGFLYPALMATGLAGLKRHQRPVFMGWITFSFNAGFAVCVLGLGPVADAIGYPAIFIATGILIASGVLPMALRKDDPEEAPPHQLGEVPG